MVKKISLPDNVVATLGLDDELAQISEAADGLRTAIKAAQAKLKGNPIMPFILNSISHDHGGEPVSIVVDEDGVSAVLESSQDAPVKAPKEKSPATKKTRARTGLTANEVKARANKIGFDLGDRPLRSGEQKTAAWAEMDTFESNLDDADADEASIDLDLDEDDEDTPPPSKPTFTGLSTGASA